MEKDKFKVFIEIVANTDENNTSTTLYMIKVSFKKVFLGKGEIRDMQSLWFEKEEIKNDAEYYHLISSLIDIFIKHYSIKKSFNEILFSQDIFSVIKKTKYFLIYSNLIEISKLFDLSEQYYIEIICTLYILGIKKETPVNEYFIDTLKELTQDDIIKNSSYYSQIKSFKYENINESFMKNLLLLYKLIMNKGDEEKIRAQIKLVENPEENKDKGISIISSNFENSDNEENKFDYGNKNRKIKSPAKEKNNPGKNQKK